MARDFVRRALFVSVSSMAMAMSVHPAAAQVKVEPTRLAAILLPQNTVGAGDQNGPATAAPTPPSQASDSASPVPPQANAEAAEPASPGDIVVTGSRVITNGNNSPTPVTVVSTEALLQVTPSNVPDALNRLPIFSGSSNQSSFGAAERNFSGNYLNLRNVGAGRSLILFDGHRFPPTTTDNLVDINTIPQMLLQRVEVVTGGASAVYGSDAITGVVNFIIDNKFNGVKFNA